MWGTSGWYMDKFVVGPAAAGSVDIEAPIEDFPSPAIRPGLCGPVSARDTSNIPLAL
jgi:hypothetical protein